MPGAKYYMRQANAFLSLAQWIEDAELSARYRMMARRYSDMASESSSDPQAAVPEQRAGKDRGMQGASTHTQTKQ
jgi:hypothetical protein